MMCLCGRQTHIFCWRGEIYYLAWADAVTLGEHRPVTSGEQRLVTNYIFQLNISPLVSEKCPWLERNFPLVRENSLVFLCMVIRGCQYKRFHCVWLSVLPSPLSIQSSQWAADRTSWHVLFHQNTPVTVTTHILMIYKGRHYRSIILVNALIPLNWMLSENHGSVFTIQLTISAPSGPQAAIMR